MLLRSQCARLVLLFAFAGCSQREMGRNDFDGQRTIEPVEMGAGSNEVDLSALPLATESRDAFVSIGIGGGGAMFAPSCSPHNPKLMFVACDMGGVYRTEDGGGSWRMLDKRQLRQAKHCPVQFHPNDPNAVYAAGGSQVLASNDSGRTFQRITADPPWSNQLITALAITPRQALCLLVGVGERIYVSCDGGRNWTQSKGRYGRVFRFFAPRSHSAAEGLVFAGTSEGILRSDDLGRSWSEVSRPLPRGELVDFCGSREDTTGQIVLFCTIRSRIVEGSLAGGVFCSRDLGASWQLAMGEGLNLKIGKQDEYGFDEIPQYQLLAMAENRPSTVYVTSRGTGSQPPYHFTVYRSDDFGAQWRACFNPEVNVEPGWLPLDRSWGFGGPAIGFCVSPSDPDVAMLTNMAELYTTHDGGDSWQCAYSRCAAPTGILREGQPWTSNGLEVTGAWQFALDPYEPMRAYICYTDIGFARSEDRGKSWRYSGRGSPWRNTWYGIVFDPLRAGVIYSACSNHHDIPHYKELDSGGGAGLGGGVCISRDSGKSWQRLGQGLPEAPVTSIVLDPSSRPDSRTLYITAFGHGVFMSTDSGKTWRNRSQGLGTAENKHAYSIKRHPDGTLFCSVTGKRAGNEFVEGSGLYRSINQGKTWQLISPPLKWAGDFDFDPASSRTIYLTASTAPRHPQGGLYRTTDAGESWTQVVKEADLPQELHPFIHAFFVTVHPKRSRTVYFSAYTHGLFLSEDAGESWREVKGIPFTGVQRVTFDPLIEGAIWVTTHGGGVWIGPERGLEDKSS